MIPRSAKDAVAIPQRATVEILDTWCVWDVGEDRVVHQRPITIEHELEDGHVVQGGLGVKDEIVPEWGRRVKDGRKLGCEFREPEEALAHQKHRSE